MMRNRFRTALADEVDGAAVPPDDADPQRALSRSPTVGEHLERDVVREHDEEREHDDARGHISVPRAPVHDIGAE